VLQARRAEAVIYINFIVAAAPYYRVAAVLTVVYFRVFVVLQDVSIGQAG
jgi:hypothetical protein